MSQERVIGIVDSLGGRNQLEANMERLATVVATRHLPWKTALNEPASAAEIEAALRTGLFEISPSLERFYRLTNGAELFGIVIFSLNDALERTQEIRDMLSDDEASPHLFVFGDLGDGNHLVLNMSVKDRNGESPVVEAYHDYGATEWFESPDAESFEGWLNRSFQAVLVEGRWPFQFSRVTSLDDVSPVADYQHRVADESARQGDSDAAQRRYVRAFSLRKVDDTSGRLRDATALERLDQHSAPAQILRAAVRTEERAKQRSAFFLLSFQVADAGHARSLEVRGIRLSANYLALVEVFYDFSFVTRMAKNAPVISLLSATAVSRAHEPFFKLSQLKDDWFVVGKFTLDDVRSWIVLDLSDRVYLAKDDEAATPVGHGLTSWLVSVLEEMYSAA